MTEQMQTEVAPIQTNGYTNGYAAHGKKRGRKGARKSRNTAAPRITLDKRVLLLGKNAEKIESLLARFEGDAVSKARDIIADVAEAQKAILATLKDLPITQKPIRPNTKIVIGDKVKLTDNARLKIPTINLHGELEVTHVYATKCVGCKAVDGTIGVFPPNFLAKVPFPHHHVS